MFKTFIEYLEKKNPSIKIKQETISKLNKCLDNYENIDTDRFFRKLYKSINIKELELKPNEYLINLTLQTLNNHWREYQKHYLNTFEITIQLKDYGFYGNEVDKNLIGLILNHLYQECMGIEEIKKLHEQIRNYLIDKKTTKFSDYVSCLMRSKTLSKYNIPYPILRKQASDDVELLERTLKKYDYLPTKDSGLHT